MAKKETSSKAYKFVKPSYIIVTPFVGTENGDVPTGDDYILEDVVRDTTSVSQDENDTNTIERETSDSPILEIVTLGKWQFAAEVADTQADLLEKLCGFTATGAEGSKKIAAPSNYQALYAKIAIVHEAKKGNTTVYRAFVLPKVQLNSRVTAESLNTNIARIALAGTAQDAKVDGITNMTPFYVDENYTMPTGGAA